MSYRRAGKWNDSPFYGQRGLNGRRLCLECGEELSEKRKRFTFCGDRCRELHEIKCHPSGARWAAKARDHGVCVRCGLDCQSLDEAITEFGYTYESRGRPYNDRTWPLYGRQSDLAIEWLKSQGFVRAGYAWKSAWEAHHKRAVVEGGGESTLDNYETLCVWCHQKETAELRRRVRRRRRAQPELV